MGLERPLRARGSGLEGLADKSLVLGRRQMLERPRALIRVSCWPLFRLHGVGAVPGFMLYE